QPLPTIFAWWTDKSPEWFKHFSVAFCLTVEIIVPLFIWAPRRVRLIAAGLLVFLQIAIAITGNYCFFNLLTIALCLLLIDDGSLAAFVRRGSREEDKPAAAGDRGCNVVARWLAIVVLVITLPLNAWHIYSAFQPQADLQQPVRSLYEHLQPFYIANGYGLFRVMTKERPEIQVEGSADGIDWIAYEFRWKPGDVN